MALAYVVAVAVLGIDIGGTGIKGAPVDVRRGVLTADRIRLLTPHPATPDAVVKTIGELVSAFSWTRPLGVTFPGVVVDGEVRTATNLDKAWVGVNLPALLRDRLQVDAVAINDADAAGVAEAAHGAAKGAAGLTILLTFGTGVGSGMLLDGRLIPNSELGRLEMDGKRAELSVAEVVREKKKLSWKQWAPRANDYLAMVEALFSPSLFVIGGGIDSHSAKWLPLLKTRAPIKVAALGNQAGIVGAAMTAQRSAARGRRTMVDGTTAGRA